MHGRQRSQGQPDQRQTASRGSRNRLVSGRSSVRSRLRGAQSPWTWARGSFCGALSGIVCTGGFPRSDSPNHLPWCSPMGCGSYSRTSRPQSQTRHRRTALGHRAVTSATSARRALGGGHHGSALTGTDGAARHHRPGHGSLTGGRLVGWSPRGARWSVDRPKVSRPGRGHAPMNLTQPGG
jgi:hypothetical protein